MEKIAKGMRISMGAYCWAHTYFHRGCRGRKEIHGVGVCDVFNAICLCVCQCLSVNPHRNWRNAHQKLMKLGMIRRTVEVIRFGDLLTLILESYVSIFSTWLATQQMLRGEDESISLRRGCQVNYRRTQQTYWELNGNTQSLCSPINWKFEVYYTRRYYKARYMLRKLCLPVRQSVCLSVAVVNRVKNTILSKYRHDVSRTSMHWPSLAVRDDTNYSDETKFRTFEGSELLPIFEIFVNPFEPLWYFFFILYITISSVIVNREFTY